MMPGAAPRPDGPQQVEMRPQRAADAHGRTAPPFPGLHRWDRLRANWTRAAAADVRQTSTLDRRATRHVRGAPKRKHTRHQIPTKPTWRDPALRPIAIGGSRPPAQAMARWPKSSRISPALPALIKQSRQDRGRTFDARQSLAKERSWQGSAARPYGTFPNKSRQSAVVVALAAASHGFKTSDRPPAVNDQDWGTPFETID